MPTLGLIHTSLVFITRETLMADLFRQIMPDVRLVNFVDDSLLCDVMARGDIGPAETRRVCAYAQAARDAGCDAALSLCSSLGPAIDVARRLVDLPLIKIDEAMARRAVELGPRVGVVATVPTTLGPTVDLIEQQARHAEAPVDARRCLVQGAFDRLMAGDRDAHDLAVLQAARGLAADVDAIVFAQASMTRLADQAAQACGRPVLTSPRLGIEHARRVLDGLAAENRHAHARDPQPAVG